MISKKIVWTMAAVATLGAVMSSCDENGLICINGKGPLLVETRVMPDFNRVRMDGAMEVILVPDGGFSVELEAQEDILDILTTEVVGGQLRIDFDDCIRNADPITATAHLDDFAGMEINGSGDVESDGLLQGDQAFNVINGSGDMDLDLGLDALDTRVAGSGDFAYIGEADMHDIHIEGSGNVKAFNLNTSVTDILIEGSGNCEVYVEDELHVLINGSGSVFFKGNPAVMDVTINGSGAVIDAN